MPVESLVWLLIGLAFFFFIAIVIGLVCWNRKKRQLNKDEEINSIGGSASISELQTSSTTIKESYSDMQKYYALATNTQTSLCPRPLHTHTVRTTTKQQELVRDSQKSRGMFNLTPSFNDTTPCSCCHTAYIITPNESPAWCPSNANIWRGPTPPWTQHPNK
ncbi:hypothetical protein BD560DRAFT_493882 [Blakeslea trispora]|nr:hypothetical protein BD560DRAFT_493882 [Blakeslea trispora]